MLWRVYDACKFEQCLKTLFIRLHYGGFMARLLLFPTLDSYFLIEHCIMRHHHIFWGMMAHVGCCHILDPSPTQFHAYLVTWGTSHLIPKTSYICESMPRHYDLKLDGKFSFLHHIWCYIAKLHGLRASMGGVLEEGRLLWPPFVHIWRNALHIEEIISHTCIHKCQEHILRNTH